MISPPPGDSFAIVDNFPHLWVVCQLTAAWGWFQDYIIQVFITFVVAGIQSDFRCGAMPTGLKEPLGCLEQTL